MKTVQCEAVWLGGLYLFVFVAVTHTAQHTYPKFRAQNFAN